MRCREGRLGFGEWREDWGQFSWFVDYQVSGFYLGVVLFFSGYMVVFGDFFSCYSWGEGVIGIQ